MDSIGLTRIIAQMNAGEDLNGREIDAPTSFFIGVALNPAADDLDYELERFEQKLEAGAQFAMTQVLFDLSYLDDFLARLGGSCPIPLLVGVFYVRSYQLALRLHNEVPGIVVPDHVQARLRDAGSDAAETGLALAKELVEASRERAAGVYVIPPFRQPLSQRSTCSGLTPKGRPAAFPLPRALGARRRERAPASFTAARTTSMGTPNPPLLAGLPGEDGRAHAPARVDARPARVPRPHDARAASSPPSSPAPGRTRPS